MAADPYYKTCARKDTFEDHECQGRITWEHVIIHAGKQLQAKWAIIPICEWAHSVGAHQDGGDLDKEKNQYIAINRATDEELEAVSGAMDYQRLKKYLNKKYKSATQQRTNQQNKALHLYFTMLAEALNDAGLDMRTFLKPGIDIPWDSHTIKEHLWRPVQKIVLRKDSTTELTKGKKEIDRVYEVLNRRLAQDGVHVPFPSIEGQLRTVDKQT